MTSVSAASAAIATPLVQGDEVLSILPGTLPSGELTRRLADSDAAVVLKLGRSFPAVREALSQVGAAGRRLLCRARQHQGQRVLPAAEVDGRDGALLLAGDGPRWAQAPAAAPGVGGGGRAGPGRSGWMTPQSRRNSLAPTDLIGYGPYLDRVRTTPASASTIGQHAVESERARVRPRPGRAGPGRGRGVVR